MVRGLELEVWGKSRRRNPDEFPEGSLNVRDSHGKASCQSGFRRSRDRSQDFDERGSASPK